MAVPNILSREGLVTSSQAADMIGLHRNSIWNAIRVGHLKATKIGNAMGLQLEDVTTFRKNYLRGTTTTTSVVPAKKGRPPLGAHPLAMTSQQRAADIQEFLESNFEFREKAACSHSFVRGRYLDWCARGGKLPASESQFSVELERMGCPVSSSGSIPVRHGLTPADAIIPPKAAQPRVPDNTVAKRAEQIAKADARRVREMAAREVRQERKRAIGGRPVHDDPVSASFPPASAKGSRLQEALDEISQDKSKLQARLTELQLQLTELQSERDCLLKAEAAIGALLGRDLNRKS